MIELTVFWFIMVIIASAILGGVIVAKIVEAIIRKAEKEWDK